MIDFGNFETSKDGWSYEAGKESPGVKGGLQTDNQQAHGGKGSLRLEGNFQAGGHYVEANRKLLSPARLLQFWVRTRNVQSLEVRLTDFSGQVFLHAVQLTKQEDWQLVILDHLGSRNFQGGAGDGTWYGPMKEISVRLEKGGLLPGWTEGIIWIDDVSVEEEPAFKPIAMEKIVPSKESIFGFSNHMMHTDLFYGRDRMGPYFRMEYILPWVVNGHFGLMREPIYQGFFAGESRDEKTKAQNRARIEAYLDAYSKAGVRVLLCPLFARAGKEGFDDFFRWLGSLPGKYPAVIGFEMHNEPHLNFFGGWKGDEYAEAVKRAAGIIHEEAPNTPIVVGSMSHLWWGPAVKFFETAMDNGILDVASGISVHPYRKDQAPEGGAGHSAKDDPSGLETEMRDFWALVQKHNLTGKPLELYLTEFGYSSGNGKGSLAPEQSAGIGNEERQADYLSRMMLILFDLRLQGIPLQGLYWYNLKADRKTPEEMEGNFGLIDYEAQKTRPGYPVYAQLARTFEKTGDWWSLKNLAGFTNKPELIKSFTWQRLSDQALIVPFWRMNQFQKEDVDFESEMILKLPAGLKIGKVKLHDLYEKGAREVQFTESEGSLRIPLKIRSRTAWVEVFPDSPSPITVEGSWQHTLPAEFGFGSNGQVRIEITGPLKLEKGKDAVVEIGIDNRDKTKPFAGTLHLQGREIELRAKPEEKATFKVSLPSQENQNLLLAPYYFQVNGTIFGRGDFAIVLQGP